MERSAGVTMMGLVGSASAWALPRSGEPLKDLKQELVLWVAPGAYLMAIKEGRRGPRFPWTQDSQVHPYCSEAGSCGARYDVLESQILHYEKAILVN